ncbi:hypothetical protein [Scytonema millei]|uniref:Uncharacterized protein n=1 Tax=Scytonema millei VB511283 TaxID=1245923 RepID=A0A9X5E7S0_9CYAN|nr:hypothetical protein [Scytonema millei]NHC36699.1 hypothetical protein [Scytonema millei VB511283]
MSFVSCLRSRIALLYGKVVTTEFLAIAPRAAKYSSLQILTIDNFYRRYM